MLLSSVSRLRIRVRFRNDSQSNGTVQVRRGYSEREAQAELNLSSGRRGLGDGAELRRVDEAVRRAEVRVVQGVEELGAELEAHLLGDGELALQREVERLEAGAVDGVAAHVAEGEGGGRGEGRGVEPLRGGVRAGAEDGLARVVGADGVLAEKCSGVGRVAEDRDGEGVAALRLEERGEMPVARD